MLHGHNEHLGWANTVNLPDLADVYKLELNPENPNQYKLDGQWREFQRSEAHIRVHLFGPFYWTATKPVLRSAHGPVLQTDHGSFALRYAGHDEGRQALQYYRLDKARDMAEWRAAMGLQLLPSINYLYADERGNIGYVYNGQYPDRREGVDWKGVLPGDRSDLIWTRYLPFDKVPQIWNPRCGLVLNSNNSPFHATACADDGLDPKAISPTLGLQTNMTNRSWRALENFGADEHISAEAFRRYKFDTRYSRKSSVWAIVQGLIGEDAKGDAAVLKAQEILKSWDGGMDVKNRGAALVSLTTQPILVAENAGQPPPAPRDSLMAAMRVLRENFGKLDPEWGEVNRIRRGKVDLAIDGGADTYRSVWGRPQKDGTLTADAGDTLIMFVQWDAKGVLSSQSVHQFGSATLDKTSPHYADQTPMFVKMQTKPVLFTEAQLKGHVTRDYAP
jgi:penicillin amidase/acyl-homoserine-lactone acylase